MSSPRKIYTTDEENDEEKSNTKNEDVSFLTYSNAELLDADNNPLVDDNYDSFYDDFINNNGSMNGGSIQTLHTVSKSGKKELKKDVETISLQLSQWNYKNNRKELEKAITSTSDILNSLKAENLERPFHIPIGGEDQDNLTVLNLQLKLEGNHKVRNDNNLNLDKEAIAKLFQLQIDSSTNHLESLMKRISDVNSKVFITGDVNTGKSNFCNTLLKRNNLLPEDQLPCTFVFCEIFDSSINNNLEEVHAITTKHSSSVKEASDQYNIADMSTYEIHNLSELPTMVEENQIYVLLKIYIKDARNPEHKAKSLLNNGIVNISLIDSPGLNIDSVQTAEVLARQEEIDLVIFVVNAENQLTLSARDFIQLASKEKKLMFFVIKKFDKIKNKERCKQLILNQIKELSPETYKQANEFVHFIEGSDDDNFSSNSNNDNNNNNDSDEDNLDYNNNDPKFQHLENSLRNFILKKRSLSKLLPAKTYLTKLLTDIKRLSMHNQTINNEEENRLKEELDCLQPHLKDVANRYSALTTNIDGIVDRTVTKVSENTKQAVRDSLDIPISTFPMYKGLSRIHDYIFYTDKHINSTIRRSILDSEQFAKIETQNAVDTIISLGKSELGEEFGSTKVFHSDLMFKKKYHATLKKISISPSLHNLIDPSWNGFLNYLACGWRIKSDQRFDEESQTLVKESSNSITSLFGLNSYSLSQYWLQPSLLFTSSIPALAVYSVGGIKVIGNVLLNGLQFFSWNSIKGMIVPVTTSFVFLGTAYLIHDLPRALPKNLLAKYKEQIDNQDYINLHADRISKEIHQVLKYPVREIIKSYELLINKQIEIKKQLTLQYNNASSSVKFFDTLLERTAAQITNVGSINLDVD